MAKKRRRTHSPTFVQTAPKQPTGTVAVCAMEAARYSECSLAIARLEMPPGWQLVGAFNYDVAHSRNFLADTFTGDYLFFMDDDQVFPPDVLKRLLAHNLPIVGPLVLNRRAPFRPCPILGA